jgi:hypothetical protein
MLNRIKHDLPAGQRRQALVMAIPRRTLHVIVVLRLPGPEGTEVRIWDGNGGAGQQRGVP